MAQRQSESGTGYCAGYGVTQIGHRLSHISHGRSLLRWQVRQHSFVFTKYQLVINHEVRRGFMIRANVGGKGAELGRGGGRMHQRL